MAAESVSAEATQTGEDGLASVVRTLGTAAGEQHTVASSPGLAGSPLTFTHRASAGAATVLEEVSGNGHRPSSGPRSPIRSWSAPGMGAAIRCAGLAVAWVVGDGGGQPDARHQHHRWRRACIHALDHWAAPATNRATAVVSGVGTVGFSANAVPGTPPGLYARDPASRDGRARRQPQSGAGRPTSRARRQPAPRLGCRRERGGGGRRGHAARNHPPHHRRQRPRRVPRPGAPCGAGLLHPRLLRDGVHRCHLAGDRTRACGHDDHGPLG